MTGKEYVRIGEAAEMLPVTTQTIRNWIRAGKIRAERTEGGHYRIPMAEITRLWRMPSTLPAYNVCIVCKHQLNKHRNEGEFWRCGEMACDLSRCECHLDAVICKNDILYYDLKTRWSEAYIENFGKDEFDRATETCKQCNGTGFYTKKFDDGDSMDFACETCLGTGRIIKARSGIASAVTEAGHRH